jgi:hypothetical protein
MQTTNTRATAFVKANPMRAAIALANVQYVLAEMQATDEGRAWTELRA